MPDVVTFDGPNKIITEIANGSANEIDVLEVYSEWKDWVKMGDNGKFLPAFTPVGGDPITDTQNLGITYFLENGWRIRPAELDHKVTLVGNIYTRESGQSVFLDTIGAFTVNAETRVSNLVDSTIARLDLVALLAAVYIDTSNGTSGTGEEVGTPTNPVNNLADARVIADRENLRTYNVRGTITLDQDYSNWTFEGERATVNLGGQNVANSRFEDCILSGATQGGSIECNRCSLGVTTELAGLFRHCGFQSNFSTVAAGVAVFTDCYSEVPGDMTPLCNVNGATSVNFRNYSGGLELTNVNQPGTSVSVDLDPGHLTLASSCTDGEVLVRGVGRLTDNSVGTAVVLAGLVQPGVTAFPTPDQQQSDNVTAIVNAVFARVIENGETFEEALRLIRAEAAGTITVNGTANEVKSADGTKTRILADADENGRTILSTDSTP